MFREDDGPWYGRDASMMHPSYRNKPKVGFQEAAQQLPLEGSAGVKLGSVLDEQARPVPTTYDTRYDPAHPKADWAGSVAIQERAHYNGHRAMQEGITTELEGGIVSKQEVKPFLSRRRGNGPSMTATTPGLIGGISGTSEDRYTSVARAASRREPTSRDQLTVDRRTQGMKHVGNPAQNPSSRNTSAGASYQGSAASAGMGDEEFVNENIVDYNSGAAIDQDSVSRHSDLPLLGYRGPPQTKSFTSGLAASLAVDAPPSRHVPKVDSKDTKGALPGYTGYRRRQQEL